MSKLSLLAMAAIASLTACSAAARSEVESTNTAPPISTDAVAAPQSVPIAAAVRASATARAEAAHPASNDAVSCEVRSRRTAHGLLIQARALANREVSGEYDLVITKSGGAGSSDISQSGPIDLAAGVSALLGENEISVERGARVRAVLTLRDGGGELCRRTLRL